MAFLAAPQILKPGHTELSMWAGRATCSATRRATLLLMLTAGVFLSGSLTAASIYKYRDANGNLIYAELQPDPSTKVETIAVNPENKAPLIAVEKVNNAGHWEFRATNECLCIVEFELRLLDAHNLNIPSTPIYHSVLQPQSQRLMAPIILLTRRRNPNTPWMWRYPTALLCTQHVMVRSLICGMTVSAVPPAP